MTNEIKFAFNLAIKNLSNNGEANLNGLNEIMHIYNEEREGKYTTLLEHCKAIRNILDDAIEQMESEK